MEEDKEDAYEASAFEALEKDFQEVLQELVGDKSLENFRVEYEKLHRALKKSHESEKRLIKKCRELNQDIVSNAVKVQNALKLSQEDQTTISSLKKEIERAWKMVEGSHEKEQRAKDTIHNLKVEITSLSKLVEQGAGLSINQENRVNKLVQEKNDLLKQRDMLQSQVSQLGSQNHSLKSKAEQLKKGCETDGDELEQVKDELSQRKTNTERELIHRERLDQELKESRQLLDVRAAEIKAKVDEVHTKTARLSELTAVVKEKKSGSDTFNVRINNVEEEIKSTKKMTDNEAEAVKKYRVDIEEMRGQLDTTSEDKRLVEKEREKMARAMQKMRKEKEVKDAERKTLEGQRNELKTEVINLSTEFQGLKRQEDADQKTVTGLQHERDLLQKQVVRGGERVRDQVELVRRHASQAENLQREVQRWKSVLSKTHKRIAELQQQCDKYSSELQTANGKYIRTLEELKSRDQKLVEIKKAIGEVKGRLGQQKNLYEAVCTDRNLYFKNLVESGAEIAEMKRKFLSMNHQIDNLKDEIKEKDQSLIKKHIEKRKVQKRWEMIKDKLTRAEKRLESVVRHTEHDRLEIKKLEGSIAEFEGEQQTQRKEFERVISERDILGTQLIRRNEELSLLYEKIKVQQSTLQKGEAQYRDRCDEIRLLMVEVGNLRRLMGVQDAEAGGLKELEREVYHLEREVLHEKAKVKALSEELENPMNVHRWRQLEGSDPQTFELLQKVKTLQSRLIAKSEEVCNKDGVLGEKEKAYGALKAVLARQPGPEIAEAVVQYRTQLEQKLRQMRAMQSEVKTYQQQVMEYKDEVGRVRRELQQVKRKFFEQKKREQTARDEQRPEAKLAIAPNVQLPRYTGGGFCLTAI